MALDEPAGAPRRPRDKSTARPGSRQWESNYDARHQTGVDRPSPAVDSAPKGAAKLLGIFALCLLQQSKAPGTPIAAPNRRPIQRAPDRDKRRLPKSGISSQAFPNPGNAQPTRLLPPPFARGALGRLYLIMPHARQIIGRQVSGWEWGMGNWERGSALESGAGNSPGREGFSWPAERPRGWSLYIFRRLLGQTTTFYGVPRPPTGPRLRSISSARWAAILLASSSSRIGPWAPRLGAHRVELSGPVFTLSYWL